MPRCRMTPLRICLLLTLLFAFSSVIRAETALPDAQPAGVRVWVRPLEHEEPAHTQVRFQLEQVVEVDGRMTIPCQVDMQAQLDEPRLWLQVYDGGGTVLFEGDAALIREGTFDRMFVWPLENVPDGIYRARLAIVHAFGEAVAWRGVQLEKRTYGQVWRYLQETESLLAVLGNSIEEAALLEIPTYAALRTAVAADALVAGEEALQAGDWPRAHALLTFAESCADSARALITFASLVPELGLPVLVPPGTSLQIQDGAFYASGNPVFLSGPRDPDFQPESLAIAGRFGFNFASVETSPANLLLETGVNKGVLTRLEKYLDAAGALDVGVTVGLATETAPP